MSWVVVISNENSTKMSYTTLWNHEWYLGVFSSSQGAACAVGRDGGAAQSDSARWRRSLGRRSGVQQGVVRGSAGIILVSHVTTVARQALRPGRQERDVCTLLLTKSVLGLPGWTRAGYQGIRDVRPACMCQIQVFSGVRRCCKVGLSCMRRVVDCSSVPHKMAWRNAARAIWAVSRHGGPGCEIFDISQLRFVLDSLFQELDTPLSRCCWRCACAMSGVSLITADIDPAFEACSASAVLPARRHTSQSDESSRSSNSVLVRRGRRELCKLGRSQSFGR